MKRKSIRILLMCLVPFLLSHPQNLEYRFENNISTTSFRLNKEAYAEKLKVKLNLISLEIGIIQREIENEINK